MQKCVPLQPGMRSLASAFFLGTFLLLDPSPIKAQSQRASTLWPTIQDADQALYESKLAEGDEFALMAASRRLPGIQGAAVTRFARAAIRAYEEASRAKPTEAEPHKRAAIVFSQFLVDRPRTPAYILRMAIANWDALERKAPLLPTLPSLLFSRSIALTKLGGKENLKRAVSDYDHELKLHDLGSQAPEIRAQIATILSNRAEILMALGRLDEAIAGYRESLSYRNDPLYGYGLAVALDRDGQGLRAREIMRAHANLDVDRALHSEGTFFVPPGEIHYYEALRLESLNQLKAAQEAYGAFLESLPQSPWAKQARDNLAGVKLRLQRSGKP